MTSFSSFVLVFLGLVFKASSIMNFLLTRVVNVLLPLLHGPSLVMSLSRKPVPQ
jgi:hypothetical protein